MNSADGWNLLAARDVMKKTAAEVERAVKGRHPLDGDSLRRLGNATLAFAELLDEAIEDRDTAEVRACCERYAELVRMIVGDEGVEQ